MLNQHTSLLASAIFVSLALVACSTTQGPQTTSSGSKTAVTTPGTPVTPTQPAETVKPNGSVTPPAKPGEWMRSAQFDTLPGWQTDDLRQAWQPYLDSCEVVGRKPDWREVCALARLVDASDVAAIRNYFETNFEPHQLINADGAEQGLITGYYEPLLHGARKRGGRYQTPLYAVPDDLLTIDLGTAYPDLKNARLRGKLVGNKVVPYPSRGELLQSTSLSGKELFWVDDAVEAFFLQVQGSGRVQLADGKEVVRVAYADQNGHPYKSIGRYLVDKGELTLDQASAQGIRAWITRNPTREAELFNANPSYVFFREEKLADPSRGPKGSLGLALTPERSIAVDTNYVPLGAPVFLATTLPNSDKPLQRLVLAHDTGGAIRNPVRADYFWGFGSDAAENAGRMKQRGLMWVLLPKSQTVVSLKQNKP